MLTAFFVMSKRKNKQTKSKQPKKERKKKLQLVGKAGIFFNQVSHRFPPTLPPPFLFRTNYFLLQLQIKIRSNNQNSTIRHKRRLLCFIFRLWNQFNNKAGNFTAVNLQAVLSYNTLIPLTFQSSHFCELDWIKLITLTWYCSSVEKEVIRQWTNEEEIAGWIQLVRKWNPCVI